MKESAALASIAAASRVFSVQCATSALNSSSCDILRTEKNSMAKMSSRFLSPFFTILAVFCLLTGRNPFFFSFLKCKICTSLTVTLSKELKMPSTTTTTALHFCFLSRMQKLCSVQCVDQDRKPHVLIVSGLTFVFPLVLQKVPSEGW